jgi:tetratricopeptide (TPR) repeat protein
LVKNALELSIKALEICSQNVTISSEPPPLIRISETQSENETQDEANNKAFAAEYYLLRLMHSWKSSRLDLADHFYAKYDALKIVNASDLSMKEADLFDEIASSLKKMKQPQDAMKWYERAFRAFEKCEDEATTQEAAELKLCVGVSLGRVGTIVRFQTC